MSSANQSWIWINPWVLMAAHDEQLAEHGGASGVRDAGLFESALARSQQLAAYGEPDIADLAASYGVGLVKNHPFVDGNERTAFVAVQLFLVLNGCQIQAGASEHVLTMLAVASGDIDEVSFAAWIRGHIPAR